MTSHFATWRLCFYIGAAIIAANMALIIWALPAQAATAETSWAARRHQIIHEIDWVGTALASISLAMFSYVFATITGSVHNIREPSSIALLCIAAALVPAFIVWVGRQERLGRPAVIPNSLWRNSSFTSICIMILFNTAVTNGMEVFASLL